ncbi:sigma-70 family RNA polymerase sigma factor [Aureimonas leprariae]|uniref:Sigma-70 family RNA polymerase sigma factor n=1 Tax=Plantimonas leprariae TaxID=2615207 RepID=A0A7V7PT44_9HYPH|nr:sigma-70 family RNA polymerase sigma factor [Aureimonas leprariae]KAB0682777.1 sigma-70 family RNA polymerase sigma factor [Aureimonas leprariae]
MSADGRIRFDRLILPRFDDGFRLARWLTGNPTDAEDVMQEASLRAFLAIDRLVEHNVRAWFLTIVRNACYSWLEKHRPGITISSEQLQGYDQLVLERGGVSADPAPTPEEALIAREDAARLTAAIDGLPLAMKEVLVLREYHDLSYREIAEISGVPVGTVMSRLARARRHLLARFDGGGDAA